MKIIIGLLVIAAFFANELFAQPVAFPGASGFGSQATGGRSGTVYHVTSLADSGAGTFREAVSAPNRTVVFDVSGVIHISAKIKAAANLTIAGQTAPGEGVVVYGNGISLAENTIVRYMRFRGSINMDRGACTVNIDSIKNVILDHVSIEWGRWDNLHIKNSSNVTLQYCLIGEPIDPQRFGALFEHPTNITIHHCLWIDCQSRNPKAKAAIEYINNVVYNWGVSGLVGGHSEADHFQDVINNYFIAGPNTKGNFIGMFTATDHVYHSGNIVDDNKDGVLNGRAVIDTDFVHEKATLVTKKQNLPSHTVTTESAEAAFKTVMNQAGASLHRDAIDQRLIGYLNSLGAAGKIFKTEVDAGGQGEMVEAKGESDSDGDGIPDKWETANQLNSKDPKDAMQVKSNGYTPLEEYVNQLVTTGRN
ncbi:hypothetical protein A4D02_16280 [Niastella koreensis]|uniref:Pectate lyase n=2 Tax=Niastella koreensis TaxID=354356 RepID=G8TN27_NIAKG|nr:hypothetical protein [Niastella koreensis]AEV97712.1 hypothetical protein Niako_1341 [Niastella koreensis GR20-10]OQP40468.1 hypothetical protein A4D02_16280 [Niastella koreensis]